MQGQGSTGNSLVVQGLRLCTSIAWGTGSIPGLGIKIPQATWHSQREKKKSINIVQSASISTDVAPTDAEG